MIVTHLRFGFLLASLFVAFHVGAEPRFWTLAGVQFEDGAVATGYFSYDDATRTYADWNVRVSSGAGPFIPWTYVPASSNTWPDLVTVYSTVPGQSRDTAGTDAWWRWLDLRLGGRLDGSTTTVPIDVSIARESFESELSYEAYSVHPSDFRKVIAGSLVLTTSPPPTQQADINQHGLTGAWYIPGASGQGIAIEVYQDAIVPGVGYLHGAFATHAVGSETGQRWYTFGGTIRTGDTSSTVGIYQNKGGNFNAAPATESAPVGTMLLTFVDCSLGVIEWNFKLNEIPFTGWGSLSGRLPLLRLMPNVTCSSDVVMQPDADFSYSGNWFDRTTPGQGLFLELNRTAETSFMVWYTYARDGASRGVEGQRWYTGQGHFVPGARTLPLTLYETTGSVVFGWDDRGGFVPASTQTVGTATVAFHSCRAASLTFSFTGGTNAEASGTINLSRVGPTPADCFS